MPLSGSCAIRRGRFHIRCGSVRSPRQQQEGFVPKLTIAKKTTPANGKDFPFRLCELTKWGSNGAGNGQFASPSGVAVDGNGNVYVSDALNSRIQKFDSNGG